MKKRLWFWILLFVFGTALIGTLATSWNMVLVLHGQHMRELAEKLGEGKPPQALTAIPWFTLILGSLGFAAALAVTVLFFARLLKEMQLNQMQTDFLAKVSHELKTPVATLELTAGLLRQDGLDVEQVRRLWESHDADLTRLQQEVETLLDASRWQSGFRRAELRPVALGGWLREQAEVWKKRLGDQGSLELTGDLPAESTVRLDPEMFKLITDNLVDNARKYAQDMPSLRVSMHAGEDRWRLEFQDDGWGFDPAETRMLFRRFYRGRNPAPYAIPGTGLGLFLAHQACRAQGFKLRAESAGRGKGASFTLEGPWGGRA